MASEWYYIKNGIQNGPVTSLELKGLAESNLLSRTDLVWKEGMAEWVDRGRAMGAVAA